jgi:hypothetical protein
VSKGRSTLETARKIALALPTVEEGTSYGTPAFRARKKFFARLREDGDSFVVKVGDEARDTLLEMHPEIFYVTDHYAGHPVVLIRLSAIRPAHLEEVMEHAWRALASKRAVAEYDERA